MEVGSLYLPNHRRQFGWGTGFDNQNCNPTSTAMLIDWETLGQHRPTPPQVRAEMPDYPPEHKGTNLEDSIIAARRWGVKITHRSITWDRLINSLAGGRANIVLGDYEKIPDDKSCQPTFDGNHSMIFFFYDVETDEIFGSDPLCKGRKWYPAEYIREYALAYGNGAVQSGVAEKRFVKAKEGSTYLPIHRWPNETSRVVATLPVTQNIRFGSVNDNWYTVWYLSNDGRYRRLFVNSDDAQRVEF